MKRNYFPRLALDGVRKNKQMYIPYLLTCIGMVMMYYIIDFLRYSDATAAMSGGGTVQILMTLGNMVILIFSCTFLIDTNSFLMKSRMKEFGLYNILGMEKKNIARLLFWESFGIYAVSVGFGLLLGITFSKLFELGLVNLLNGAVTYSLSVSGKAIKDAVIGFAVIFFLLYINTLIRVRKSTAIALLKAEHTGEREPKGNLFLGIAGVLLLAAAYYLAVTIKQPLSAVMLFFVAVIMVIAATYMIMISGSVVFCRMLKKNKRFYYKADHFVSVSSMAYRMKRNGAGLAVICILATMVLVMISSTASLYFGVEDSLKSRYPRENVGKFSMNSLEGIAEENRERIGEKIDVIAGDYGVKKANSFEYASVGITAVIQGNLLNTDPAYVNQFSVGTSQSIVNAVFVGLEDYNRLIGEQKTLSDHEVILYEERMDYPESTILFPDGETYRVKEKADRFMDCNVARELIVPSLVIVVSDLERELAEVVKAEGRETTGNAIVALEFGFDTGIPAEKQVELRAALQEGFHGPEAEADYGFYSSVFESREEERVDFFSTFGGLFFLGIILSAVFIAAAVLIIYYRQISEGYEDHARFDIMQKVGMTKKEIKRSINSQLLMVFYIPLLGAGLHMIFAFPMISRLLMLFQLNNTKLFAGTCIICFAVFGVFYAIVYRMTSKVYYNIVSGGERK